MALKKKILVVDDEVFFRSILKDGLKGGYDIIEAENGEEGIALALSSKPDLIILDVEMPRMSGFEVCKVLKGKAETRKIPLIMFTSLAKKKDLVHGLQAGADDYVSKPVSLPEVLARVEAHLRTTDYYTDLKHSDLLFLLQLTEIISAVRNPMTVLQLIVEKMSNIIDVARCSIVSVDENGVATVRASSDFKGNEELGIDVGKYPEIRKSLDTKQVIVVNDMKNDPLMTSVRDQIKNLPYNSIIVVPVIKKESVIGTFLLSTTSSNVQGITERVNKLCQMVANISANALENAILFRSMKTSSEYFEEMAIRDSLTLLYNHRHFYCCLEREFSRAQRYNSPLSLVFFDLDEFKGVNDTFGHLIGDKVLCQLGEIIRNVARESDVAARYGGDEFAILLPNTAQQGAIDLANRLCTIIHEHAFQGLSDSLITISVGLSTFEDGNIQSFDRLVRHADEAMYKAKASGRNQIIHASVHL
ncbi:diguanylate cyclase [Malonomonas rubra]|uniref:diguanylate cyclase n=1 Tax=Malonomonas rubra TaxID=57040 RepID=UPI0026EBFDF1|nr:diguanylate cyclase [Malonomonas rubra]